MIRVDKFCCCCTLRTGATVFAVLTGIDAIANIANGYREIVSIAGAEEINNQIIAGGGKPDHSEAALWTRSVLLIISGVGFGVSSVFLCIAISNGNHRFVLPWLGWQVLAIIFSLILVILDLTLAVPNYVGGIILLIVIPLSIYIWICMYSFYLELKEGGPPRQVYKMVHFCPLPEESIKCEEVNT